MWFTPLPRLRLCTETHVYRHMFTPCLFTDICLPVQTHGKRLARGVEAGFGLRRAGTSGGVGGSGAGEALWNLDPPIYPKPMPIDPDRDYVNRVSNIASHMFVY
jgi:hypothetical protein